MHAALRNRLFVGFGILFVLVAAWAMYLTQPLLLVLPFGLLYFLWVCHDPFVLFWTLIAFLPWSIEFNFTPSLGTDLPTEPLMLLTSFSILCFVLYHRRRRPLEGLGHSQLFLFLLLQAAWWGVSAYCSTDFGLSLKYCLAKGWYFGAFLFAPYVLFRDPRNLVRTVQLLCASMLLLVARALLLHAGTGFSFTSVNAALYPHFRNHVNYSSVLACIIPMLVAGHHFARSRERKKLMKVLIGVALVAIVLSYARGAWVALVAGGIVFLLMRRRLLMPAFFLVLLGAGIGVYWLTSNQRYMRFAGNFNTTVFHTDFQDHLRATYQFKDLSNAERIYRWIAGMHMVREHWATGWGPNTYVINYKKYTVPAFRTWVSDNPEKSTIHNYYLFTTIEQGFVGLLLLLLVTGYAFYVAQKVYVRSSDPLWRAAAAVAGVVLMMECTVNLINDLVETDKLGSLFYLSLATLIAAEVRLRQERTSSASRSPFPTR
ncbi:O-antigen ligase family protein [Flaviaesturariibacter aridisoli]|uniref:O-antigen ligase domain-containing protein n=1 Tax=Flaviaesturariibacter aridisoli TaxID=2545761 RepID=A0A4R4E067_9BACT|nr:O-antigen ligase family protein [Flaviaesturariibacter aridisoli]TCZ72736.1 O-antigen ligase domain-containing protein [Flaviaesturariibacter aridisoli]